MKRLWRRMRSGDRLVVPLLLTVALVLIVWQLGRAPGRQVVVEVAGEVVYSAPLSEPRRVELPGPLGSTELSIADGAARILASPCPNKVCIGMGPAMRQGDLLACVPNRVLVRIEGGAPREAAYDILTR